MVRKVTALLYVFLLLIMHASVTQAAQQEPRLSVLEQLPATGVPSSENPYKKLKVPTQITKIGELYFIVDCYHNQVLWSNTLEKPLEKWKIVTNAVTQPHSIAGNGSLYMVDDTENNRILIFERQGNKFCHTQTMEHIGTRPHYIVYDKESDSFWAWSSLTGEMYILKQLEGSNRIYLAEIRTIDELAGYYVRSFTIIDDVIYFPAGNNGYVIAADKNTFQVMERYPVTDKLAGMAQIVKEGNFFYFTVSTSRDYNQAAATMGRTTNLKSLEYGSYEEVYDLFGKDGTPYYISKFEGTYYLTHHRVEPGIWKFKLEGDKISQIKGLYN